MAFPVMAALIGAGIGAVGTKMSGGSNRDMIKNALLGAAMGTGVGYLGGAGAASGMSSVGANTPVGMQNFSPKRAAGSKTAHTSSVKTIRSPNHIFSLTDLVGYKKTLLLLFSYL